MKYLKMLGLAAIAAMGLMAFLGASSASATTLCSATDTPDCETVHWLGQGTVMSASLEPGTTARLTSGGSTIATCTTSEVNGTVTTKESPTWVEGEITGLTWGEPEGKNCSTTTDTLKKGKLKIMWIEGTHNGTVEAVGAEVTLTLFGVSCTYGAGEGTHLGTLTSGSMATLKIETIVTKTAGGFLCPGTAGWDAAYTITSPEPLYVTT